jgi:NifU-like protein
MGAEALQRAVADWARKRHLKMDGKFVNLAEETAQEGRVVCHCFSLTEPYLKRKIRELGLHSITEISNALKAGGACGQCQDAPGGLQDLLHEVWGTAAAVAEGRTRAGLESPAGGELSPYRRGQQIERVLREKISPLLQQEGGDIELIDIKGYKVYCHLGGRCTTCRGAPDTLKLLVEQQLKELVDDRLQVIAV